MEKSDRQIVLRASGCTDIGKVRSVNQDRIFVSLKPVGMLPNLFVVADGMGGHKAGDLASAEAVRYFIEYLVQHSQEADDVTVLMDTAARMTNRYIYFLSQESMDYEGMGTTLVAATIIGNMLYCLNVGDSRLYVVEKPGSDHPMTLRQVTVDHSMVEMLVQSGVITEEEARVHPQRNVITRAIGIEEEVEPESFTVDIESVYRVLLCSDGLSSMVGDIAILSELTAMEDDHFLPVEETSRNLVDKANENGGKDNISAIVIDCGREEDNHA